MRAPSATTKPRLARAALAMGTAGLALAAIAPAQAQVLGTGFTYQGQLTESGQPANGLYDIQVCVFDSPSNPSPLNCTTGANDVPVDGGVFTLSLNFGSAMFIGLERFLELRVRPGASVGAYAVLAPRQLVRPAPEALRANAAGAAPWSGLTGVPAGFADGVDDTGSGGTVTSITAGTGLSGGTITGSGTIGIANGGVTTTQLASGAVGTPQLADGAVTAAKLGNGTVGLAQINATQVQTRVVGACAAGEYLRGVNADGSVVCGSVLAFLGINVVTTVDAPSNSVGEFTDIAIGRDGRPVVSYYDNDGTALKVAKCANSACTGDATITVVDGPANLVGEFTSIIVGDDGRPVISYYDATAGTLKVAQCANPECTGSATITTVDNPANNVGQYTSIALGTDGRPVISYRDLTNTSLKVAKCANAACTGTATITTIDDPINNVGAYSSIAIGTDGRPVISYYDATADALKVAKCANAACTGSATITTIDDGTNNVGQFSSIAVPADGRPLISYHDATSGSLRVARCANASCTSATLVAIPVSGGNVIGRYSAIAIGTDDLAIISFYDATLTALRVVKCLNSFCSSNEEIRTLDDPPGFVVGLDTSIAVGSDGLPVISYRNGGRGELKVAKCGNRSCE